MQAAEDLGYRPSYIARSLIQQSSRIIGIVMKRFKSEFYMRSLDLFTQQLQRRGYATMVFNINGDQSVEESMSTAVQYQVDGLVVMSATLTSPVVEECVRLGTPLVLYNRISEGINVHAVSCDQQEAGRIVARFLRDTGHRRVVYVAGEQQSSTNRDREAAFTAELSALGGELMAREPGDFTFASGVAAARSVFGNVGVHGRPDAIFCANDYSACGLIQTAQREFGIAVPDDVSVIGFDDISMSSWPSFRLTSYRQPIATMVDETVNALLRAIDSEETHVVNSRITGRLVVRESVADRGERTIDELLSNMPFADDHRGGEPSRRESP